jgi:hypothetical protein
MFQQRKEAQFQNQGNKIQEGREWVAQPLKHSNLMME